MNSFMHGFLNELEKAALDLRTARKMTQALKAKGQLIRRSLATVFHPKARGAGTNRGPVTVPAMSREDMRRSMRTKGLPTNPAHVAKATKSVEGLTRGKSRIFSKGDPTHAAGGLLRPKDLKKPEHKEMAGRMALGHEGSEIRHMKDIRSGKPTFRGHTSPGVLVEESSMVASLPKSYGPVKEYHKRLRKGEGEEIARMVPRPGGKTGFQYGKRYSRHARKRIAEAVRRKMGVQGS